MKVIKPLRLGVLTRPFEQDRKHYLSIAVVAFFPFDQPERLLPEVALWKLAAEVLGAEGVIDECMPKLTAEVLVAGSAFPRSPPQPSCRVRVRLGAVDRSFYVFGDRHWQLTGPTDPQPFEEMPLTWSRAFGGPSFARNPLGKGAEKVEGRQPLPNVESPKQLVGSPGDRPEPACPMSLDLGWPQRVSKSGTYDKRWLEERYPGFPADFDWSFFQVAQETQRLPAFLEGGETFVIENMHREEGELSGRLPRGRGRAVVVRSVEGREEVFDVATRIDTVWLFPNQRRGAVIHRGVVPIAEDDAADVLHVVGAYELPGAPRPLAHYQKALADRLSDKDALLAVLRDKDLLPELPPKGPHPDDELSDMERLLKTEHFLVDNARRGAARQLQEGNEKARALVAGTPAEKELGPLTDELPPRDPPPTLDDLPDIVEKAAREAKDAERVAREAKERAEAEARELCEQHGLDYEKVRADARERELKRKRRVRAGEELENLEATATLLENAGSDASELRASLADPKLLEKLTAYEAAANEGYRRTAHLREPTLADPDDYTREELELGAREGRAFTGRDLTRADLHDLDLRGVNLEAAFLERADLRGARLDGANLRGAVLAHADLTGASLVGADLGDANLGGATLDDARLDRASLERTILWGTIVRRASLAGARLAHAQLGEATLEEVDLSGAELSDLLLYKTRLHKTTLAGARLSKSVFVEGELVDVDLRRAKGEGIVFVQTRGERVRFDGAELPSVRFVKDCELPGASFVDARMKGANLRGTALAGADLTGALLDDADLSEADLTGARLDHLRADNALFIRTRLAQATVRDASLVQAILQKARVEGADFRRSNLFRADALQMRGDTKTSFQDAFVKRVRFTPEGRRG